MKYFKIVLWGITAAFLAVVLFVAVMLGIANWHSDVPDNVLLVAVIVRPDQIFIVALIGFVLGVTWSLRRRRRMRT